MVNIIKLKESIYSQLNTVQKTFEVGQVPKGEKMPYITYALGVSAEDAVDNTDAVAFHLEVTILDHNKEKNTDVIEDLVNQVDAALAYKNIIAEGFYYFCIRGTINPNLPTTDEFTFRRELRYTVKTYVSEEESK